MRLQSAVFTIEDTLLDPSALPEYRPRPGLEKTLSLLKMEGVWMYAVTAMERGEAEAALRACGLGDYFHGLLTTREAGCTLSEGKIYEKAMRRLRSLPRDTVYFTGRPEALRAVKAEGYRAVAVAGTATGADWDEMVREAEETVLRYDEFLA